MIPRFVKPWFGGPNWDGSHVPPFESLEHPWCSMQPCLFCCSIFGSCFVLETNVVAPKPKNKYSRPTPPTPTWNGNLDFILTLGVLSQIFYETLPKWQLILQECWMDMLLGILANPPPWIKLVELGCGEVAAWLRRLSIFHLTDSVRSALAKVWHSCPSQAPYQAHCNYQNCHNS